MIDAYTTVRVCGFELPMARIELLIARGILEAKGEDSAGKADRIVRGETVAVEVLHYSGQMPLTLGDYLDTVIAFLLNYPTMVDQLTGISEGRLFAGEIVTAACHCAAPPSAQEAERRAERLKHVYWCEWSFELLEAGVRFSLDLRESECEEDAQGIVFLETALLMATA